MKDTYRVLPHRDIEVVSVWQAPSVYFHKLCGMTLTEGDVKDANWCPYCAAIINKAARRRGQAAIAAVM